MSEWYEKNGSLRDMDNGDVFVLNSKLLSRIANEHNALAKVKGVKGKLQDFYANISEKLLQADHYKYFDYKIADKLQSDISDLLDELERTG